MTTTSHGRRILLRLLFCGTGFSFSAALRHSFGIGIAARSSPSTDTANRIILSALSLPTAAPWGICHIAGRSEPKFGGSTGAGFVAAIRGRAMLTGSTCRAMSEDSSSKGKTDTEPLSALAAASHDKGVDPNAVPSKEVLNSVLEVAIKASRAAGEIIVSHAGGAEVTETKANSRDLLTLVDPLCEQIIRDTILESFPDHDFLGEEDVAPGKEASAAALEAKLHGGSARRSDWLWICDPIDGTTNFVHGMPLCMPSVAVAYKNTVVVGCIYDPHRDELFSAVKGQGAYLNLTEKIRVGSQGTIGDAVVAMGSPPAAESLEMSLKGVKALMPQVRTIRMLGSAALMLAWVACGRLTVYWEYDLSSWDIAAGALLVQEAGGSFTDLNNDQYDLRVRKMIASNGLVHNDVLKALHGAGVI